ncbi:cadherin-20-like [Microcaecilia unicolor]|uniref:Cadherin-20-like n=1 Tax=Microcaecilia unicolor TaxID=1415580 RepID=A0A6P7WXE5_9AMPH|nr:cadherin-20-like [Microcaecilia unicolor]
MIYSYWLPVLLELVWHWSFLLSMESRKQHSTNQQLLSPQRVKRSWVWNQFFVLEEQTLTKPLSVGQLRSDSDKQDGSYQYRLSGEGAGNIFTIDENTGTIYVVKKLDREKKSSYTLRAQAINKYTGLPVEPESEFIIKVQDINDNRPQFLNEPYVASIPEMSPEDLKMLAYVLASRLNETLHHLIHEDYTGFVLVHYAFTNVLHALLALLSMTELLSIKLRAYVSLSGIQLGDAVQEMHLLADDMFLSLGDPVQDLQ